MSWSSIRMFWPLTVEPGHLLVVEICNVSSLSCADHGQRTTEPGSWRSMYFKLTVWLTGRCCSVVAASDLAGAPIFELTVPLFTGQRREDRGHWQPLTSDILKQILQSFSSMIFFINHSNPSFMTHSCHDEMMISSGCRNLTWTF